MGKASFKWLACSHVIACASIGWWWALFPNPNSNPSHLIVSPHLWCKSLPLAGLQSIEIHEFSPNSHLITFCLWGWTLTFASSKTCEARYSTCFSCCSCFRLGNYYIINLFLFKIAKETCVSLALLWLTGNRGRLLVLSCGIVRRLKMWKCRDKTCNVFLLYIYLAGIIIDEV